jgi:hypothetical protein
MVFNKIWRDKIWSDKTFIKYFKVRLLKIFLYGVISGFEIYPVEDRVFD